MTSTGPASERPMAHNGGADGYHDRPFVAGTLTGIRQWRLSTQGVLISAVYTYVWQPGTNTAMCDATRSRPLGHRLLHPDCGCGFWAQTNPAGRRWYNGHDSFDYAVTGVISGWGKAVAGPLGFRVEHARITGIVTAPIATPRTVSRGATAGDVRAAMRAHYPDVTLHGSQAELLEAYPLSDLTALLQPAPEAT